MSITNQPITVTADIGGTWIKLARFAGDALRPAATLRLAYPCRNGRAADFAADLKRGLSELLDGASPAGIGISTAGVVNYAGNRVIAGHAYLDPLKSPDLLPGLQAAFGCPAVLINDADAALIGAAQAGYFTGSGCHGLLALGTGCGFALWKNGQRWRPDRQLPLLGALRTAGGSFDELCSASALAAHADGARLERVFTDARHRDVLDVYLGHLARLIDNATLIYHCESLLLTGGLVAAALEAGFDLAATLAPRLMPATDYHRPPLIRVAREGNDLPLLGVRALIAAEAAIAPARRRPDFAVLATEAVADSELRLERCSASELIEHCLRNENAVTENWNRQAAAMTTCATRLSEAFQAGGRLIYLGCGTSGRLAALDALELNCTFGLPKHQALALIAGGAAEAAASIEEDFEEDASVVPELLLLTPGPKDVVIGISASGSAWYVRSGLAFARRSGAFTVLLSASPPQEGLCDLHIGLDTGAELVTGSTRMKAGTVTKKILNAVSTTSMILCGKVTGTHMVDVACLNDKLVERACGILQSLHGLQHPEALDLLRKHNMRLSHAMQTLTHMPK
ncbi:MAG: N-acetylmuramic acid 6-phosphate etherase [Verrucomicrobia bacterium]|nr:N-acetylmuramic acid 6-phosphate etherase [Verrucomicrobiota bacterium]